MKVCEYQRSRSLFYHIFPGFVCFVLYLAKISGERLHDHWSSGITDGQRNEAFIKTLSPWPACSVFGILKLQ